MFCYGLFFNFFLLLANQSLLYHYALSFMHMLSSTIPAHAHLLAYHNRHWHVVVCTINLSRYPLHKSKSALSQSLFILLCQDVTNNLFSKATFVGESRP